jgi:hypothetical protein
METVVSWAVLDETAYAGARVVVTPGDLVPSGPDDPRAIHLADVSASTLTTTWTAPYAGAEYTIAVFARDSAGGFSGAATGRVRVPGVLRHLVVGSYRGAWAVGAWVLPPGADAGIVCFARDGAPAGPSAAETCSPPGPYQGRVDTPGGFGTFSPNQFAAFARAAETGVLGPRSLVVGETPPPFPANRLSDIGAGGRHIDLEWDNGYQSGGALNGVGGTVTWLVYRAKGRSSPAVVGSDAVVEVPVPDDSRVVGVVQGLARDMTYTFAIRGRDAEGNLSDWSEPLTTATRRPGLTMVSDGTHDRRWRRSPIPGTRASWDGSAAVTRHGSMVVGSVSAGSNGDERVSVATRSPGEHWRQRLTDHAGYRHLAVDPRSGTLFAASFQCIHSRRPGRAWQTRWCSDGRVNDGVHSLVLDRAGHAHALVDTLAGLSYVSNAGGRWRVQSVALIERSYAPILLRYDRATNALVLLAVGPAADDLRVATKRPRQGRFGPWRSWYLSPSPDQTFSLSSAAADAGRLVAAVTTWRAAGGAWGQPMLLSGPVTGRATAQAIRGTVLESLSPIVAVRGHRVHVAWTRATELPGHPAEGVWSSGGRWDADRGRWVLSRPERRTVSAYDRMLDLDVGSHGRAYLLVQTVASDGERLRPG